MIDYNDIAIIIPFHKNKRMLSLSLMTLKKSLVKLPEVIIIANNSNPNEIDISYNEFRVIKTYENIFWPGAINLGVQSVNKRYVVFCDPDIFYMDSWLDELIECYCNHDNVGAVSAKLINPLNNRIMDFGMFYNSINVIHSMKELKYNNKIAMQDRQVSSACGAIMLTEKRLFERVGGIDSDMPYIYCDNDYCLKLQQIGKSIWVAHKSIVYHIGNTDMKNSKYEKHKYLREDSKAYFYAKNYNIRNEDFLSWLQISWDFFKNENSDIQDAYILLNFSTLLDDYKYICFITEKMKIRLLDKFKITLSERNCAQIQLYNEVPIELISSAVPFIYLVDEFTGLINNELYFKLRDIKNDIVMDKNGNILKLSQINLA